jgi:ABC-2 type transport system ATP-binding protein
VLDTQGRKLSLGERMKVELIGAILHQPKVLFLDEPTIGLDIIAKQSVRKFLRQIQREMGVTLRLTSHDMDDIENVCDRVIVINKGEKIYDNSLQKLTMTYSESKFVKVTYHSTPLEIEKTEIIDRQGSSVTYRVARSDLSTLLSTLAHYDVDDIDILSVPLEEMIRNIFESDTRL